MLVRRLPSLCPPAAVAFALLLVPALAAQAPPPCSGGETARQFDFWIGEWEVTAGGEVAGHNSIRPILDGCVLQESWRGASGSAGSSFNFYNPQKERWEQLWVWRNGTTLLLGGGLEDGVMVLAGDSLDRQGKTVRNRITWTPNPDGSVRQRWQTSLDGGASWQEAFDGLYRKRPAAEAP